MDMLRITARWSGFNGAPGYTNLFFGGGGGFIGDEQQVADRVRSAFGNLTTVLAADVDINLMPEAAVINSDTGELTEYRQIDPGTTVSGASSGAYSAASGAVVNWRTNDVRFGRRIQGRTFLVPLSGSSYQSDGTLATLTLQEVGDFAEALTAPDLDSEFGVWSRPRNGSGGVFATVVGYRVPDMAAVLRSRRD